MNLSKALLLAVILTATGLVVLPNTVSLFAGQHYWYNLSGTGNDVPCEKCHADVFEELSQSTFHIHWGDKTKADREDCAACHRSNLNIQYASVNGSYTAYTPGKEAHAASVVACMLCHQANASEATWAPGYYAGGFNVSMMGVSSPYNYSNATFNGMYAAHNAFVAKAIEDTTLQDSNEACIACHTHVAVKINWTHARSLEFDIGIDKNSITTSYGPHNWTITNWSVNGTAWDIVWGNTTGYGATNLNNITWPGNVPGVSYNTS